MDGGGTYEYDKLRSTTAQVLATLALECLTMNVGIIVGMPVLVIGALRLPGSDITLTDDQASWFAGLIFMVQPFGSMVSGFLQDLLGRKLCMMLVNVPQLAAWIAMYYATSAVTLFVSVAVMGVSLGFMEAPVLSYVGEISEPRLRGVLSTLAGMFLTIGLMISAAIGAAMDWRTQMLTSALSAVVAFLALALIPESPAWLVTKGRVRDAEKAYQWLRGWVPPEVVKEELETLVEYVKNSRKTKPRIVNSHEYQLAATKEDGVVGTVSTQEPESQLKIFLHPSVQRPLRLIVIFFIITACASLTGMRPYLIEVLASLNLPVRPHLVIVYGSVLVILGSAMSTLLMRRIGKRGLAFSSLGLGVASCLGLGVYFYLDLQIPWLVLTIFCVSFFAAPLGMIPVPWILVSEAFPLKGRGLASGVAAAFGYVTMFLVIKTYFNIVAVVGVSGACILYGVVGLLGFIYLYFHLPETEGVTLQDVERIFYVDPTTNDPTETFVEADGLNRTDFDESEKNVPV